MTCPECQGELTKTKTGYLCLHCGYAGKGGKAVKKTSAKAVPITEHPDAAEIMSEPSNSESSSPKLEATAAPKVPIKVSPAEPSADIPTANDTFEIPTEVPDSLPTPNPPEKHRIRLARPFVISLIVLLLIAALAGAYVLPARSAAKALNKKLGNTQSLRFAGNLKLHGSSFLSVLNSDVNFDGTYASHGDNQINYHGLFASRSYDGQFITHGSKLYVKMTGSDLPFIRYNQGLNTYHILPDSWYQTKLDNSLYKYYCETRPDTKYPSPLIWYQAIRQVKLKPSPLVVYGQKVDGHSTTHLRGTIDSQALNAAWVKINSSQPDDCQWDTLLGDVSHLKVRFDTWTSSNYDKILLHFDDKTLGLTGSLTLKLDQYNQAAKPTVPATVQDLAAIFSLREAVQSKDYQRRADIDALNAALKKYYAANKQKLPTTLAKLAPTYINTVPQDPDGGAYSYTVSKKTYTLSATLRDAGQLYTVTGP